MALWRKRPGMRRISNLWSKATSRPYSRRRYDKCPGVIFNFWKRGNLNISNRSPKAMNLTSHGVKRNLMAKFVWTLDLAAESYGANTWFGAGKSSYNARADCSKMQKTNNMDSGLQMEDQLGLLIMRTELGWNHSSAEVKLSMNKADFKGLRTKQNW